ncbi:MAG: ribokinase [Verrucomicrobiota bacterium]
MPKYGPGVLVVGSSNTDLVLTCDKLPNPGETVLGGAFEKFGGGKGANQAVAAARAGSQVFFVGARGKDDFGKAAEQVLRSEGIHLRHFFEKPGVSSGVALIFLGGSNGENLIGVARSANDCLSPEDIEAARLSFSKVKIIVTQLEIPLKTVRAVAQMAGEYDIPLILNPAPAQKLPASLLRQVYVLTPNEHEVRLLSGEKRLESAAKALVKKGCRNVVVTRGAKGALWVDSKQCVRFPAPKVKVVDSVGAGDCFTGWLSSAIAKGAAIEEAIPRALRAASLSVTRSGAQSGMPYRDEL